MLSIHLSTNRGGYRMNHRQMCKRVISHYGVDSQVADAMEESKELERILWEHEIVPNLSNRFAVINQIIDVYNILTQLCLIFEMEEEYVAEEMQRRMKRTMKTIKSEQEGME